MQKEIGAAITTAVKKQYLPSHIVPGENYGLSKPSMVLIEQIRTVNKSQLRDYVGVVNNEHIWKKINIAIKKTFGFGFIIRKEQMISAVCARNVCKGIWAGQTMWFAGLIHLRKKERNARNVRMWDGSILCMISKAL